MEIVRTFITPVFIGQETSLLICRQKDLLSQDKLCFYAEGVTEASTLANTFMMTYSIENMSNNVYMFLTITNHYI